MARTGRRGTGGRGDVTPTPSGRPPGALWYRPKHDSGKARPPRSRRGRQRGFRRFVPHRLQRLFQRKYWWLWVFVIAPCVLILGTMATLVIAYETIGIPDTPPLKQTTYLYDDKGHLITTLFRGEDRTPVPLSEMPKNLIHAVLATEDAGYYHHGAVSPVAIVRAAWADVTHGSYVQGGSTITQQYVKLVYTGSEQSIFRKIKEAIIAIKLEHKYTKNQILEKYLNTVYFGHGAYGVQAAAKTYWGIDAKDLSLVQDATLAGEINAPSLYDAIDHRTAAKQRRNFVLQRMVDTGYITQAKADALAKKPVRTIGDIQRVVPAPYFTEYARRWLVEHYDC